MQISVKIRRQKSRGSSFNYHTFAVEVDPNSSTVLDVLQKIQWEQDGSLVFRRNCRNVICGSCGMKINGKAGLACQKLLSEVLEEGQLLIEPMGNLPVIKDLVVDMNKFWQNLAKVDPFVSTASRQISNGQEFLQTPTERNKLQSAANCILCGSCYSECNVVAVNENFVGPHALAKAYRVLADNRDDRTENRISKYNDPNFVWGCTRCYNCNEVCPVEVEPLDRISQIKHEILQNPDLPDSTAQRHRHTMVELVKTDGWIDESKFGIKVVGDNFKDLMGLMSIVPLGLRMIASGKMPYPWFFEASDGVEEIKALIEAVQNRDKTQDQTEVIEDSISRGG
jgi:succinate dehydrogenase / fumarate reductase, iron-sulfur subunit